MPLIQSGSKAAVQKNFEELLRSGRKPDQAFAIAKSVQSVQREHTPAGRLGIRSKS